MRPRARFWFRAMWLFLLALCVAATVLAAVMTGPLDMRVFAAVSATVVAFCAGASFAALGAR